ncbi:MAG TPA: formylglycine-generating enzyme family protein, partial [Chromatiales bacterium]|nr:formylglycine-generating enzyme family protein [Chromatiales bacterium]
MSASSFPPEWACEWGQDADGLYADFAVDGIHQRMRWIPPGEFLMGSPPDESQRDDNEGPQHRVRFEEGFWLADTACTQALWVTVMGVNPSRFKGDENPVESVSWNDARQLIEKINRLHPGLELRLPSESEWEYACRAGTTTRYWFGDEIDHSKANYGRKNKGTVPVKRYPRNPWGLYQMHGNVWEWCEDAWHSSYEGAPADGQPWKTRGDQEWAVLRGGSWIGNGGDLRSASRDHAPRDHAVIFVNRGFRLARGPELKPAQPGGAGGASGQPERGTSE